MVDVVVIDNGGANIASLRFALDRLGATSEVTNDVETIQRAPRVLLPGVGAAGDAMQRLNSTGLAGVIRALRQPVFGICLGMQLLFDTSEEDETRCLAVIPGRVTRLPDRQTLPVPHMGWNQVVPRAESPLTRGLDEGAYLYFVHSYVAPLGPSTVAVTDYGGEFPAVVRHRNFHGTQFHPERSSRAGQQLLARFLELS